MREFNGKTYEEKAEHNFGELVEIVSVLRSENGCKWDRAQTHETLKKCLADEAEEDRGKPDPPAKRGRFL